MYILSLSRSLTSCRLHLPWTGCPNSYRCFQAIDVVVPVYFWTGWMFGSSNATPIGGTSSYLRGLYINFLIDQSYVSCKPWFMPTLGMNFKRSCALLMSSWFLFLCMICFFDQTTSPSSLCQALNPSTSLRLRQWSCNKDSPSFLPRRPQMLLTRIPWM